MNRRATRLLALAAAVLGGCQAQPKAPPPPVGTLPYQVLLAGAQCGSERAGVRALADVDELRQIAESSRTLGTVPDAPAADATSILLHLAMGQQPNTGYGFTVTGVRVNPRAPQRLLVDTRWVKPEPGRMYAQMITRPCIVLAVPRGDFRGVSVLDEHGRERMAAELP